MSMLEKKQTDGGFCGPVYDSEGGTTFSSGGMINGPHGQYFESGDTFYGTDGSATSKISGMIQQTRAGGSRTVFSSGTKTWYGSDGKTYFLQGNGMLQCSDGRYWFNVESEDDAQRIIAMDF